MTDPLTPRHAQILELVAEGMTDAQIARRLGIARGTVKSHLGEIYARLRVANRTQAAVTYLRLRMGDAGPQVHGRGGP
jgi:DNA-binding NarL/FixJ family response regulator